jgi:hypothetical protein
MWLIASPGAASTSTATAVVPTVGVTGPTTVAAPDALGVGDVLEDVELCKKENYSEWNLDTR